MNMTDNLMDELRDLADSPFDATCCNSGFPIDRLRRVLGEAIAALSARGELIGWQYQSRNGTWQNFEDEDHLGMSINSSRWVIRSVYAYTSPSAQAAP